MVESPNAWFRWSERNQKPTLGISIAHHLREELRLAAKRSSCRAARPPSAPGAGRVTFSPSVLTRIFTSCRNIAASMFSASAARGARKLSLRVLGSNAPALRLYERHGYVTQGRYSEEFLTNGEFVNDLTMTKALGSGHARGSAV